MKTRILTLIALLIAGSLYAQSPWDAPETDAESRSKIVLAGPQTLTTTILNAYGDLVDRLWEGDREQIQARLDAMGPKAGGLFAVNAAFAQWLGGMLTQLQAPSSYMERFAAINAKILPHTVNPDGTVTLDPMPEPAPEE